MAVIDTSDLSLPVYVDLSSYVAHPTDDMTYYDNGSMCKVYVAGEYPLGIYGAASVEITDGNAVEGIALLPSYGLFINDTYIYSAAISNKIQFFDVSAPSSKLVCDLNAWETGFVPNEIIFVGDRMFVTWWAGMGTAKLCEWLCPENFPPTTTTTTSCPPGIDCGCVPEFTFVTTPSTKIDVGILSETICTYDDYVIDWYDSEDNIVLTTGKTFTDPSVQLIHPLTGTSAVYMPAGIYTARVRYVVIGGTTYYSSQALPPEACRDWCEGFDIDVAVTEVTAIECGERNLPIGSDYDYQLTYSPGMDYKQYSNFNVQLASDGSSGYLALNISAAQVPDTVEVYWGDINDNILLASYCSGSDITSSSEGTPAYLGGDGKKAVINYNQSPYKPYPAGQMLTVRVVSNVNINTIWSLQLKCLDENAFPETTNWFPATLRNTDITNILITRTVDCIYTLKFTLPDSVIDPALLLTNFYKYNTISKDTSQTFNYATGEVTTTFNKGDRLNIYGWYGSNYGAQIDSSGHSCVDSYPSVNCRGFWYKWDHVLKSLSLTMRAEASGFYYGVKGRWLTAVTRARAGTNGAPYTVDENSPYHYYMYHINWYNHRIVDGVDMSCGDIKGSYNFFSFHCTATVTLMGVTVTWNDITSAGINEPLKSQITALEKIGGVEQPKSLIFTSTDPGGLSYTTTTTTTDEFGMGSCDTRSYQMYALLNTGVIAGVRNQYNSIGVYSTTFSGRSICANSLWVQYYYIGEALNDETEKWVRPAYRMILKSLADGTCTALTGWRHNTGDINNLLWEYIYFLSYLKVTFNSPEDFTIENFLNPSTGEIESTAVVIYPTTTSSTTLP